MIPGNKNENLPSVEELFKRYFDNFKNNFSASNLRKLVKLASDYKKSLETGSTFSEGYLYLPLGKVTKESLGNDETGLYLKNLIVTDDAGNSTLNLDLVAGSGISGRLSRRLANTYKTLNNELQDPKLTTITILTPKGLGTSTNTSNTNQNNSSIDDKKLSAVIVPELPTFHSTLTDGGLKYNLYQPIKSLDLLKLYKGYELGSKNNDITNSKFQLGKLGNKNITSVLGNDKTAKSLSRFIKRDSDGNYYLDFNEALKNGGLSSKESKRISTLYNLVNTGKNLLMANLATSMSNMKKVTDTLLLKIKNDSVMNNLNAMQIQLAASNGLYNTLQSEAPITYANINDWKNPNGYITYDKTKGWTDSSGNNYGSNYDEDDDIWKVNNALALNRKLLLNPEDEFTDFDKIRLMNLMSAINGGADFEGNDGKFGPNTWNNPNWLQYEFQVGRGDDGTNRLGMRRVNSNNPFTYQYKNGGNMINYYQEGGAAPQTELGASAEDQLMIAAMVEVVKLVASKLGGQEVSDELAMQVLQGLYEKALNGDQEATQLFLEIQEAALLLLLGALALKALHGAKLLYIKKLLGITPNGYETYYFKAGGKVWKGAKKKESNIPPELKNKKDKIQEACGGTKVIKAFKASCGKKMRAKRGC